MDYKMWDIWPDELHLEADQLKRQASARSADLTPKEIGDDYGIFRGSKKDYRTSLVSCECTDFRRRGKPCKHMYRLAFEVGLFNLGVADVNENIDKKLRIDDAMKIIESLPDDLQKVYRDVLYDVYYGGGSSVIKKNDATPLIRAHLVKNQTDKRTILESLKRADLVALIPEGVSCKKNKKSTIIDCILENTDLDYTKVLDPNRMVVLDDSVSGLALSMYRRLFQKFPREED